MKKLSLGTRGEIYLDMSPGQEERKWRMEKAKPSNGEQTDNKRKTNHTTTVK